MTREEAISIMKVIVHMLEEKYDTDRVEDAVDMAIKALEQEPCNDAISRQAVIDSLHSKYADGFDSDRWWNSMSVLYAINKVPPVNPIKTGHWKKTGFIDKVICDVCNKRVWDTFTDGVLNFQYCPNCGAKMIPTDSNCDSCEYQNEVDGSNCYECVKGIRNNYKAESEDKE